MKSAAKTKLKKLIVAVAPSAARMIGLPKTQRTPATTCPFPGVSVAGSSTSTVLRKSAETTYEHASTASVTGAEIACTSTPPMLGPAT